jgi:hypothetical protein
MRWAGQTVCMREMRNMFRILIGKTEGKNHLEDIGIDGRIILKRDIREMGWVYMILIHLA